MVVKTYVSGQIIKKYQLPLSEIDELNKCYEKNVNLLKTKSHRLAGRIKSELDVVNLVINLKIMNSLKKKMNDYMMSLNNFDMINSPEKNLEILSMWINDMKPGEYNPPHTHHDSTGWSTVLFLKVPKFLDDSKYSHKFKDGNIGFQWIEHGFRPGNKFFAPEVGDFYIFEASHTHFVMPFKTMKDNDIRRSMSFNFVLK